MNSSNLVPAHTLAQRNGVKGIIYGPAGGGKTPLLDTLSPLNPVVCVTERGMLSMANSSIVCFQVKKPSDCLDFAKWATESKEADKYGVKCMDSASHMAELNLTLELSRNKDGRKAYGEMSSLVMQVLDMLYFAPINFIALAKESREETQKRPFFPGKDLDTKVPHLFDWIARLGTYSINGGNHRALLNHCDDFSPFFARERTGRLDTYERPDLAYIIQKLTA